MTSTAVEALLNQFEGAARQAKRDSNRLEEQGGHERQARYHWGVSVGFTYAMLMLRGQRED